MTIRVIHVTFDADSKTDVTDVPNMLINQGFRIVTFTEEAMNLETAFMRLTKGVVQEFLLRALDKVRKTVLFITHDLEEALFLGDRVVIMTTRPARVKKTILVDFLRPRTFKVRSSARYLELKTQVFDAVHEEARKAFEAGEREMA